MLSIVRSGQVRSGQVRSGQVRSGQVSRKAVFYVWGRELSPSSILSTDTYIYYLVNIIQQMIYQTFCGVSLPLDPAKKPSIKAFSGRVTLFDVLNISCASTICSLCNRWSHSEHMSTVPSYKHEIISVQVKKETIAQVVLWTDNICHSHTRNKYV